MALAVGSLAPPVSHQRTTGALIYAFFFISGMPALVYQLAWQRVLFRIFGVSMDSVTAVVTAFMLGLGIGSLFGSWLASRRNGDALLIVAAFELLIGAFGVCSLPLFNCADPLVQDWSLFSRALAVICLLSLPTLLMGATLPILVGYTVQRSGNVGLSFGALYRVNSLGAVCGCALSALLLFPFLGLQVSTAVAAALNLLVATVAIAARHGERTRVVETEHARAAFHAKIDFGQPLLLVFLGGFVSLSFEIFMLRLASFASGTNSLVFSLTLGLFLLGIASGAKDASEWCKKNGPSEQLSDGMVLLLLSHGIVGLAILPVLAFSGPLGRGLSAIIALAAFLVARSLAGIFLLIAHRAVPPDETAGRLSGLLYLANIAGSAAGCLITGFVLSDLLSSQGLAVLLSMLGLGITSYLVWQWFGARITSPRLIALFVAAGVLIVFQQPLSAAAIGVMLFKKDAGHRLPLANVVENRDGIIAVDRDGVVYGGGVYDGRFNVDLVHDSNGIIRAYALSLFHPRPREVLMIGLASGSWAQVIANNPDVRHLTIVEINPGYISLVQERPEVKSLLVNPKVKIVIDDAHRWLKRHPDQMFDAVWANATYHYRSNASNLLSMEFDRLISSHLTKGGLYFFNTTDSIRVQKTGCDSFAHGMRVFNHLLVSNDPIRVDAVRWRRILLGYKIDQHPVFNLAKLDDRRALENLMNLPRYANRTFVSPSIQPIEGCASIVARGANAAEITDNNMGTEWRYPLGFE